MHELERSAIGIARENGQDWVDDVHLLLALLKQRTASARALSQCGLTESHIRQEYRTLLHDFIRTAPGDLLTPRLNRTIGRAEGLAAARRSKRPRAADYLAAIVLEPGGIVSAIFASRPGVEACLRSALAAMGVVLPAPPRSVKHRERGD